MKTTGKLALTATLLVSLAACSENKTAKIISEADFKKYWYSQGAEISSFDLKQSRYGEVHLGNAVLVYVTEPFNPFLQVKSDHPNEESVPILKLNSTRKFNTGLYPYSTMISVFTPINKPLKPIKVTFSSQEWCGMVFTQINRKKGLVKIENRSYFEMESDEKWDLPDEMLEDGIWTTIRLRPDSLPVGEFSLVLGTLFSRLWHKPYAAVRAVGSWKKDKGKSLEGNSTMEYTVKFPSLDRSLSIEVESDFPHRLQSWTETSPNGDPPTTATRNKTIYSPYWMKNKNKDRDLLNQLGLKPQ